MLLKHLHSLIIEQEILSKDNSAIRLLAQQLVKASLNERPNIQSAKELANRGAKEIYAQLLLKIEDEFKKVNIKSVN
jgi:hypothetical protein